jgi:hypothetical protein
MSNCSKYLVVVLALLCGGCVTASLATLGTVLGAVGAAASTGADVYHAGKLEAALLCSGEECHRAVLLAEADLGLHFKIDHRTDTPTQVWEMTIVDDLKSPVGVRIQSRTKTLCLCRVDVGLFGSEATARLLMERIRVHLPVHPSTTAATTAASTLATTPASTKPA